MCVDILQLHHIIGTFTEQLCPSSMADYCSSSNNINVSSSSNSTGLWTCFNGWLLQQRQELDELLEASATCPPNPAHLRLLVDKILTHFEEYRKQRSGFSERDASIMLCPPWCSSLENSLLWLGGCRPSRYTSRLLLGRVGYRVSARELPEGRDEGQRRRDHSEADQSHKRAARKDSEGGGGI